MIKRFLGILLSLGLIGGLAGLSGTSQAGIALDKPAPDFTLTDSNGKQHRLSDYRGKFVVLEWVNYDCPFVGKHYNSGNMQKLQKTYQAKGVIWLSICSSAPGKQGYFPVEKINTLIKEKGAAPTAYLLDPEGHVGHTYGAKTTPHMYIIDPTGKLVYAGGIDDIPSTNLADIPKAHNYVQAALDALLGGKSVAVKRSQPYGCSVKYKN